MAIDGVAVIPLDEIQMGSQPRTIFNETEMAELSASIKEHGVIQPIVVRRDGSGFVVVAGERRLRASKMAGAATIPVVIREAGESPGDSWVEALVENLLRVDLTPIERARAFRTALDLGKTKKVSQKRLAEMLGKGQPFVSNSLRLLALDDHVLERLERGEITEAHARAVVALTPEERAELIDDAIVNHWTSRDLEMMVRDLREKAKAEAATIAELARRKADAIDVMKTALQKGTVVYATVGVGDSWLNKEDIPEGARVIDQGTRLPVNGDLLFDACQTCPTMDVRMLDGHGTTRGIVVGWHYEIRKACGAPEHWKFLVKRAEQKRREETKRISSEVESQRVAVKQRLTTDQTLAQRVELYALVSGSSYSYGLTPQAQTLLRTQGKDPSHATFADLWAAIEAMSPQDVSDSIDGFVVHEIINRPNSAYADRHKVVREALLQAVTP